MTLNWNYPTTIWTGINRIKDLPIACKNLSIKKPLFVTDKNLISLSMTENVINDIKKLKFLFSNFTNPIGENATEGVVRI